MLVSDWLIRWWPKEMGHFVSWMDWCTIMSLLQATGRKKYNLEQWRWTVWCYTRFSLVLAAKIEAWHHTFGETVIRFWQYSSKLQGRAEMSWCSWLHLCAVALLLSVLLFLCRSSTKLINLELSLSPVSRKFSLYTCICHYIIRNLYTHKLVLTSSLFHSQMHLFPLTITFRWQMQHIHLLILSTVSDIMHLRSVRWNSQLIQEWRVDVTVRNSVWFAFVLTLC